MTTAIVGYGSSGKTTVFNALTRSTAQTGSYGASKGVNIGFGAKPDARLDFLETAFKARRKVRAEMEFWDMPTDYAASDAFSRATVNGMQRCECLLFVVRAFDDPTVPHPSGTVSWTRDLEQLLFEVAFADIELLHRRIERIGDGLKAMKASERIAANRKIETLKQLQAELESGRAIRSMDLSDADRVALAGSFTISGLPIVVAVNISEGDVSTATTHELLTDARDAVDSDLFSDELALVPICGAVEEELRAMEDDDADELRNEMYGGSDASEELMTRSLKSLNLETFYTASDKEVRAWHFPTGYTASTAAGIIHSDMQRGFIRAEIVSFEAFAECGSMVNAKRTGNLRLEGKDYPMQDGDIAHFLFSV